MVQASVPDYPRRRARAFLPRVGGRRALSVAVLFSFGRRLERGRLRRGFEERAGFAEGRRLRRGLRDADELRRARRGAARALRQAESHNAAQGRLLPSDMRGDSGYVLFKRARRALRLYDDDSGGGDGALQQFRGRGEAPRRQARALLRFAGRAARDVPRWRGDAAAGIRHRQYHDAGLADKEHAVVARRLSC